MPGPSIACAVAFAAPELQFCIDLRLPAGSTAADALAAARGRMAVDAMTRMPQSSWDSAECGVFGQPCDRGQVLQDGDRLELYRPLQVDPRESRRNRVQAARRSKTGTAR
jgi:putative ubiquitin-RnfH superfamily antitoxin RatB of RatAB toxin-antitoxin module